MASTQADRFVVGLFDSKQDAETVVRDLRSQGFDDGHINTVTSSERRGLNTYLQQHGVPQSHADFYAEGVRRQGTLVTLFADESRYASAVELMRRHGAVDINKRADYLKKSGYNRYDESAADYSEADVQADREQYATHDYDEAAGEQVFTETEEQLHIGKEQVERGGVRVFARKTEAPVEKHVTLRDETIHVHRENVDRPATQADLDNFREGELVINETDEHAVVRKEARVTGEVHVGKTVEEREEVVRDTAAKTQVEVEKIEGGTTRR